MTWNYRVVRRMANGAVEYGIHEAFYETLVSAVPHSITEEPVDAWGESLAGLRDNLQRMLAALDKTVLELDADGKVVEHDA